MTVNRNFLEYSPSFRGEKREGGKKGIRNTESTRLTRQNINKVIPFLNKEYNQTIPFPAIGEKLGISKDSARTAVLTLKFAYRFLTAENDDVRLEILKRSDKKLNKVDTAFYRGCRCLFNDGLNTWADIEKAAENYQPVPITEVPPEPTPAPEPPPEPIQVEPPPEPAAPPLLQELFKQGIDVFTQLGTAIVALQEAYSSALEENARIYEMVAHQSMIRAVSISEKQHTSLKQLESIVEAFPNIKGLYELKDRIISQIKPPKQNRTLVPSDFPTWLSSENCRMAYRHSFLDCYYNLNEVEQMSVIKALHVLAQYGRSYNSLQTHMVQAGKISAAGWKHTPVGAFCCRTVMKVRFTWGKEDGAAHFYECSPREDLYKG